MGNILSPCPEIPLLLKQNTKTATQNNTKTTKTQVNYSSTNHATSGMKSRITFEKTA